jgi:hypothetical protein
MNQWRRSWAEFFRVLTFYAIAMTLVAAALSVCGCGPAPLPPIVPADIPDGACQAAQDTLDRLGCEERATPGGTLFVEACEDARGDGRSWLPQCIANVTRCDQVEDAAAGKVGCP